jgi:S-layer protein (TIGR01567 family)
MEIRKYIQRIGILLIVLSIVSIVIATPTVIVNKPTMSENINGTYTLKANVTPIANITSVQFLYSNASSWISITTQTTPNANYYTYDWNTSSFANGPYTLNVTAKDNTGNETSNITVSFSILNIINNPPSVTVIYPNGGEIVNGTVTLNATASDSDGTIANVTFYYSIDGTTWNLIGIHTGSVGNSYTLNWITSSLNGTNYSIKAKAIDNLGANKEDTSNAVFTILNDVTPPNQVTNLSASTIGKNFINWTWSDPENSDFSSVKVYLNATTGSNLYSGNVSKGIRFFNSSNILNPNTEYRLSTMAVDTTGNINSTPVYNISSTLPNTGTGTNITVDLSDGVIVTFSNVTTSGNTNKTLIPVSNINNETLFNIAGTAYNITTTAVFDSATIEMSHSSANPTKAKLYHFENSAWKDVTTGSPDTSKVRGAVSYGNFSPFVPGDVSAPKISGTPSPTTPLTTTGNDPSNFTISFDQVVNVTWSTNSSAPMHAPNTSVTSASLFASSPGVGIWNITASWINGNGSGSYYWIWNVRPTTFFTGNRIWDGSKPLEFALTYTWTPMSFSGFYYNAKDDVGNENISITLGDYSRRTISKNNLVYTTSPQEVSFATSKFGKYQVIGFMADKYFAGYTSNTTSIKTRPTTDFVGKSAVGQGQLHKVLTDDDTKRTISVGGTLALQEGYVLKATDIDLNARTMLLSLLKDGTEVDVSPLSADETYVYSKRVGGVEDLPLLMVRFDNVFSGQELQVAFLKGIFQISEYPTIIKTGNKFRNMEITQVSNNLIEMKNSNDIGLTKGSNVDIMSDVKIIVANNDSVTRFALSVEKTGSFEIRSTVYKGDDKNPISVWTPYNFGMNIGKTSIGFYYDLDDGIGSEQMNLNPINGRIIPDQGLTYSTSPVEVKFTSTGFGKYQVIGFMADKYFAGYTSNTKPTVTRPTTDFAGKSSLANGALHKVLIDDDTKRTISVGGTIALKDGYVLKATDIDLNARVMLISLLKDGAEVDMTPLGAGETYVYAKTVGGTESLPLIMVKFDSVFSGGELQVAFLKGIFQIKDTATVIKVGDKFGKMEVTSVYPNITMSNDGTIGLDKNKNDVLMGNLRIKTADNDKLRFYFAVDVTAEMIASQLAINAPTKAMAGDTIKIKVTAGGAVIDNATISIGTETGTTGKDGIFNYTLPRTLNGTYSITATKTGYEKATQNIGIDKYVDYRLSLEAPSQANQFETITIKVLFNGTAMSGSTVIFDNTTVDTTDSNGEVTYRLETSGTHSISASKLSYITVSRDIEVRAPYSEFKGLDINITPNPGFAGEAFLVRANITNAGTMSDSLQVDLIVNGTAVDNKTITLRAKDKVEVNFTRIETKAGNVTVEIMGQSMLYEARQKPTNYLMIAGIATGIGIIIIYILTSKGLLSVELLKEKFSLLAHKFNMLFKK